MSRWSPADDIPAVCHRSQPIAAAQRACARTPHSESQREIDSGSPRARSNDTGRSNRNCLLIPVYLLLICCSCAAPAAHGDEVSDAADPRVAEQSADREQIRALVQQLGAKSFADRTSASKAIIKYGVGARAALLEAMQNDDLEIRYRAERVLEAVELDDQERRLKLYLEEEENSSDDLLPTLGRFRRTIGTDEAARQLFVRMQRAEPRLFRLSEPGGREFEEALERRAVAIQFNHRHVETRKKSIINVAALLYLTADPGVALPAQVMQQVYSFLHFNEFRTAMNAGDQGRVMRSIVSVWIEKPEPATQYQKITYSLQQGFPQGLSPAVRMLQGKGGGTQLQYAMLAVARFGNKKHIPLVESRLKDRTVLTVSRSKNKVTYSCELRDVALATLIKLTGQDPKPYGFPRLRKHSTYVYSTNSTGFADDASRDKALSVWAAWKSEHDKGDSNEDSDEGNSSTPAASPDRDSGQKP